MAKQTGLDKKTVLNICPSFLIVPASLELKAEQLVATLRTGRSDPFGHVSRARFRPRRQ